MVHAATGDVPGSCAPLAACVGCFKALPSFVCRDIVQQPDRWPAWQPRRLQLFTLAPFTAQYLAELLQQWSLSSKGPAGIANIAWMPPLAPWLPSFAEGQSAATPGGLGGDISDADGDIFSGSNAHGHLCIQVQPPLACCRLLALASFWR